MHHIVFECGQEENLPFTLIQKDQMNAEEMWKAVGLCMRHNVEKHGAKTPVDFDEINCHWHIILPL